MIDRLEMQVKRHEEIQAEMAKPDVVTDSQQLGRLGRELRQLDDTVDTYRAYQQAEHQVKEAREMLGAERDVSMQEYLQQEERAAEERRQAAEERLRVLLLPRDPNDERDVVVDIQGAEGGQEASLFAADLFRMYSRWAEAQGWKVEVVEAQENGIGGFDKIEFEIHGQGAYSRLKYEGGPHRVQRVPETESQGRIHTSAATVAVMPEADAVEIELPEKDLKIETSTSTGPGGQSVNTTYSAIRITHLPTGLVVSCQDEKSQLKNKEKALRVLRTRLYERKLAEQQAAQSDQRRSMVKSGNRSEKIRTYNFKENRVTDHRINATLYKLDRVLQGDLDELVNLLAAADREAQLSGQA
ncbi:MAG: peptide chain release factor 1 [Candidatus Dormibacteraeota bacterium]|uniref:Peptide chain release factor 1 n=1 Tax=Candidatus Dormiibacter inghamiae TaxID=3127013 RepID=A0A934NCW4_9BACT|nr:peptide chain release factor 1 [Candidatus Dormibacteraeota bacterium]MBJ7605860.1 peptide chain release factor 1 [Candidatus Dormibacteraeota bacterium]